MGNILLKYTLFLKCVLKKELGIHESPRSQRGRLTLIHNLLARLNLFFFIEKSMERDVNKKLSSYGLYSHTLLSIAAKAANKMVVVNSDCFRS